MPDLSMTWMWIHIYIYTHLSFASWIRSVREQLNQVFNNTTRESVKHRLQRFHDHLSTAVSWTPWESMEGWHMFLHKFTLIQLGFGLLDMSPLSNIDVSDNGDTPNYMIVLSWPVGCGGTEWHRCLGNSRAVTKRNEGANLLILGTPTTGWCFTRSKLLWNKNSMSMCSQETREPSCQGIRTVWGHRSENRLQRWLCLPSCQVPSA